MPSLQFCFFSPGSTVQVQFSYSIKEPRPTQSATTLLRPEMGLGAEVTNSEVDGEPSFGFKAVKDMNTDGMELRLRKHALFLTKFCY